MSIFQTLPLAERAKQLGNPEGAVGLAVAEWMNEFNKSGNERAVHLLALEENDHVLEIGFGNGRTVPEIIAQAAGIQYTGIDSSPTMVDEAIRFNAALVDARKARFYLGTAENMPFADGHFNHVFAIGVMHFWAHPAVPLAEIRRVLRPGGTMLMGGIAPQSAPEYARPEYGFHLRDAAAWTELCHSTGFSKIDAETVGFSYSTPADAAAKRYAIQVIAQV